MKFVYSNTTGRLLVALIILLPKSLAAQSATQTITVVPGWNAVWLEVSPMNQVGENEGLPQSPDDVFGSSPEITKILSPKLLASTADFFSNSPNDVDTFFNESEWEQWHQTPQTGDNLTQITGNRPYLIEADRVGTIRITGAVRFYRPQWAPDRFNLIGFGLDGTMAPTFDEFFASSGSTHPTDQIYRLIPRTGNWVKVTNPGVETMTSNECYWVYSSGVSSYMGPVAIDFDGAETGTLNFGGPEDIRTIGEGASSLSLDLEEIIFTNLQTTDTAQPALDLINPDPESGDLTLRWATPRPASLGFDPGSLIDTTPGPTASPSSLSETVDARSSATLSIGASRDWTTGLVSRTNVYRLHSGAGSLFWLPVKASLNSVQLASDTLRENSATVAGLWIGEIAVTQVASIVEDGSPLRKASAPAPIQILLHSDENGAVNLLSQVTLMQTRTADPTIPSDPVLVIDPDQIPFFEGIKERNGKRAGLRFESVAFDLPRDLSIASQSDSDTTDTEDDLIDKIAAELDVARSAVNVAEVDSYLISSSIRPPNLLEVYHHKLLCDGAIGEGKTLQTIAKSLHLDGFHRSNPFRHAYHQRHGKGPKISREFSIVFDSEQSVPGQLTGTYEEQVTGLIKSSITMQGTILLQQVSSVSTLGAD